MSRKHIYPPSELMLPRTLHEDRHKLEDVDVPIITVSATYRGEIKKNFGEKIKVDHEAVFSRAHYSMALAILVEANLRSLSSWLIDPTNYVSKNDWKKVIFVEKVGRLLARVLILKKIKDLLDSILRSNFPLRKSIEVPLRYVSERCKNPVVSMHYEAGNILANEGKKVVSVVTDPYVHATYLQEAGRKNITFAVFDEETKKEFIEKAKKADVEIEPSRIVVTGPPVDPRIVESRKNKKSNAYKSRGLRLVIATGGLGTNKGEIERLLENLLSNLHKNNLELILYASTHNDFREMFYNLGEKYGIEVGAIDSKAKIRVIHRTNIIDANQELIENAFGWADGFVTKPSGDMAYDAIAAGCFILSLDPWGIWEERIEKIFTKHGVLIHADVDNFSEQIDKLNQTDWFKTAIEKSLAIDKLYLQGSKKIVDLQQTLALQ